MQHGTETGMHDRALDPAVDEPRGGVHAAAAVHLVRLVFRAVPWGVFLTLPLALGSQINPRANAVPDGAAPQLAQGHARRRSILMLVCAEHTGAIQLLSNDVSRNRFQPFCSDHQLDIKLALKMVLVVLLLGQDGNPMRLLMLSGLAFAAFLYQVCLLA